ncbi:MAG: hypothetical protein IJ903_00025 [Ruminococcus sp.]|nr:hypothetical protein [Ruminococcus sp.]
MKDLKKKVLSIALSSIIISSFASTVALSAYAAGQGGNPPSSQSDSFSSSASYSGATTFSSSTTESGKTYSSTTGGQNALLVSGGISTIKNATVTKSGDESSENSDFTGTNAAVLAYNGATLNIEGGTVTTNGSHANGVFAYGTGTINLSDTEINTSSNNSGGIMVTGGGTLTADNLTVTTQGNSSAAIRSDRGGGTMTVNGGTYTSNGQGSPTIYSTADVTVNDAKLISTKSEGVVVEGKNSVTLNNTTLTDTNNTLNGNSTTYKNIFIYQSMSGDASVGTGNFTAKNSTITTNKGDTFYITNTDAVITLTNNKFTNTDGDFMRIEAAKWGTSGSNGGDVTLKLSNQDVEGDIIVDSISSLDMSLTDGSSYKGALNNKGTGYVTLKLSKDSKLTLTGDTYVNTLTDEDEDYSNIDFNGYKLYVNGTDIKTGEKSNIEPATKPTENSNSTQNDNQQGQPPQGDNNGNPPEPPTDSNGNPMQPPAGENGQMPMPPSGNSSGQQNGNPPEPPTDSNGNPQQPPAGDNQQTQDNSQPAANAAQPTTEQSSTDNKTDTSTDKKTSAKVTKKANTIKATAKSKSVKASKVKKSSVKIKNAITVTGAKGKVTYTKVSGSSKLTIKKDGTITVKKGTKKGKYNIKVKVTAKGNSSYKAKSKTVNIKIYVK